jgi:methylisocitrate lyase
METIKEVLAKKKLICCPILYDALSAEIIEKAGYEIAWIGGQPLAASAWGFPDLGLLTATEVLQRSMAIINAVSIPVICDVDTGFGGINNVRRTVKEFEAVGAKGIQIEDQTFPCRCGAMAGKSVISVEEFMPRLEAAVDSRKSKDFVIVGRTDCKESLGTDEVIRRLNIYADHGADLAMSGSLHTMEEHKRIANEVKIPVVANAPADPAAFSVKEWEETGVAIVNMFWFPQFAVMKTVTKAVQMLKSKGTLADMKDEFFTFDEYAEVVKIPEWLKWAEKWEQ